MAANADKKPHRHASYSPLTPTAMPAWWDVIDKRCSLCGSKETQHEAIDHKTNQVTFEPTLNPECQAASYSAA